MKWLDTHTHLDLIMEQSPELQLDSLIEAGQASDIAHWISVATNLKNSANLLERFGGHPHISVTAGIHPCEAFSYPASQRAAQLKQLTKLAEREEVVALGESGLDSAGNLTPPAWKAQSFWFERHIELAIAFHKPIIIHCREAFEACFQILKSQTRLPLLVFHCFTGGIQEAKQALELGAYLSFSGILTFKNAHKVREAAAYLPEEALLIETDAPYLAPAPYRGHPNRPALMIHTALELCRLRKADPEHLKAVLFRNTKAAFPGIR